jgi:hypothetical protein
MDLGAKSRRRVYRDWDDHPDPSAAPFRRRIISAHCPLEGLTWISLSDRFSSDPADMVSTSGRRPGGVCCTFRLRHSILIDSLGLNRRSTASGHQGRHEYATKTIDRNRLHTTRTAYSVHAAALVPRQPAAISRRAVAFDRIAIVVQTALAKDSKIELGCGIAAFCSKKQEPCAVRVTSRPR